MKSACLYERQLWRRGYKVLAGADEVGRGALAGPIVAAAVLFSKQDMVKFKYQPWFKLVADSKKLSPKIRESIFVACEKKINWAVAVVSNKNIDKIGIGEANRQVVILAINKLIQPPDYILVDYVARLDDKIGKIKTETIIHGDSKIFVIALASIMAKVYRDRLTDKYHHKYSNYDLGRNKGYGTKQHCLAIKKLGLSPIHRRSFQLKAS